MFAGHRFGFGQPHRHLGNRARRLSQFAQSAREGGEAEHEEDRPQRRQRKQRRLGPQQGLLQWGVRHRRPKIFVTVQRAHRRPGERADHGENERRAAGWTDVHGLQNGPDRLAVVICRRRRGNRRLGFGLRRGRQGRRARAQQRRGLGGGRARFEDGRRCRRFRGRERRRLKGVLARGRRGGFVLSQIQGVFDRRHSRGNRVRPRIQFCHRVRLTLPALIARGSTNAPTVSPAWPRPAETPH